jgi:hypothetical protein
MAEPQIELPEIVDAAMWWDARRSVSEIKKTLLE